MSSAVGTELVKPKLTYWLMSMMAMSSRSVKSLKASSIAGTGVSSASQEKGEEVNVSGNRG